MKKIMTLMLAASLVFVSVTNVSAVEFDVKGSWIMSFEYGAGGSLTDSDTYGYGAGLNGGGADNFEAVSRVVLQLGVTASETLSATTTFEMGNQNWGQNASGGALGTDGNIAEVKAAYIDWIVPNTKLQLRMGLQYVAIPSYTFNSSQVFNNDVAGITASYQFNENVGMTFVWARPFNDNHTGGPGSANSLDNLDMFTLVLPMTFDNVRIAPWAAYAMIGKNVFPRGDDGSIQTDPITGASIATNGAYGFSVANGLYPAISRDKNEDSNAYGSIYWLGLTGDVTANNGFRFAWDMNYGSHDNGVSWQRRSGYYIDGLAEYKMDWGTPGLYAWYGSGDDGSIKNGSERMPSLSADGTDQRSGFAAYGSPYIGRGAVIATQWTGTWGVGARLKNVSFLEDLDHLFRINYMRGTNSTTMAKYLLGEKVTNVGYAPTYGYASSSGYNIPASSAYLTTQDSAVEVGLTTTYKIYDNLTMYVDLEYIFMFMDDDVWTGGTNNSISSTDPWNINVTLSYNF